MQNTTKNIRNGKNVWHDGSGNFVKSETHPGDYWYPAYPQSRVHGSSYTAYTGNSVWEKSANRAMAQAARSNFERNGR